MAALRAMQQQHHPGCLVCGCREARLALDFHLVEDGVVEATFDCTATLQGYPDRLHGGVVCTLLDGAMTNCLFAHGVAAVTAELKVRFRQAVNLGKFATVRAVIAERFPPLFRLKAEVIQNGAVVATAEAAFIDNAGFGGRRTQAAPLAAKPSL
jgi:uncharacterized protein (TIGR00369 family)